MNIETVEKLNKIFTEQFLNENADVSSLDVLYEKVLEKDASIARCDFDEYVCTISKKITNTDELNENDLDEVAGGISWVVVGGVCALVAFCYKAGKAVGEAIANATNKK